VILTVPSAAVRKLDDPVPVVEFWVHVLDACAELATAARGARAAERLRGGRADQRGVHALGYPIMTHLDVAPLVVDLPRLLAQGSWGHFHEMGHNHQQGDWTFEGTGEVTENLFSLYVMQRCCHVAGPGHSAVFAGGAGEEDCGVPGRGRQVQPVEERTRSWR